MARFQPDLETLDGMLAADAVQLRDACANALKRWAYIKEIGVEGLQGEPWNLTADEAAAMFDDFSYVATPAMVYFGQVAQPEAWDFDQALAQSRHGQ